MISLVWFSQIRSRRSISPCNSTKALNRVCRYRRRENCVLSHRQRPWQLPDTPCICPRKTSTRNCPLWFFPVRFTQINVCVNRQHIAHYRVELCKLSVAKRRERYLRAELRRKRNGVSFANFPAEFLYKARIAVFKALFQIFDVCYALRHNIDSVVGFVGYFNFSVADNRQVRWVFLVDTLAHFLDYANIVHKVSAFQIIVFDVILRGFSLSAFPTLYLSLRSTAIFSRK